MSAQRPTEPESCEQLLARLATERRVAPAPQTVRVADLLRGDALDAARCDCPHPRQLEDLVAGRTPHKKRPPLVEHLKECSSCRRYVVGLREACSGPAPYVITRPAQGFGLSHVVGLAVAGMLLLLANSTVLDLLDSLDAPAVSVTRPAERTVVPAAPAPVIAPVVTEQQEAIANNAAKISGAESLAEPVIEQGDE